MELNRSLHRRIIGLLAPLAADREKQQAIIIGAFFGSDILSHIQVGAPPRDFAVHVVQVCVQYGSLEDGEQALYALLEEVHSRVGATHQQEIEQIWQGLTAVYTQTVPKVASPLSTTASLHVDTLTLIRYFYDAWEDADWERAQQLLHYLGERPDLPRYFDTHSYTRRVQQQLEQAGQRTSAEVDYNVLRVMAQHEPPEVLWDSLLKFWEEHPGYDPDNLGQLGRETAYIRLKSYVEQASAHSAWQALTKFWDIFPDYDPDDLATCIQAEDDGYLEALRRIEYIHYHSTTELDLSGLELRQVPPQVEYLHGLQKLSLADNKLTTFPVVVSRLDSLQELSLSNNQIHALPPEIGNLRQLRSLRLNHNALQALPPEVNKLARLQKLYLHHNQLESLPPGLDGLRALEVLDLGNNHLATLPGGLQTLPALMWLFLNENHFERVPPVVFELAQLQWLFLHGNRLTELPPEISRLHRLRWLSLSHNRLRDLPPELALLTNLEHLAVKRGNPLTALPHNITRQGEREIVRWLQRTYARI